MEIIQNMKLTMDLILDELFFHEISDQNALLFFTPTDHNLLTLQSQLHHLLREIQHDTKSPTQDASVQMIIDAFQASLNKHIPRRKKRKKAKP